MVRAAEQDLTEAARQQQQSDWANAKAAIERAEVRLAGGGPKSVRDRTEFPNDLVAAPAAAANGRVVAALHRGVSRAIQAI